MGGNLFNLYQHDFDDFIHDDFDYDDHDWFDGDCNHDIIRIMGPESNGRTPFQFVYS